MTKSKYGFNIIYRIWKSKFDFFSLILQENLKRLTTFLQKKIKRSDSSPHINVGEFCTTSSRTWYQMVIKRIGYFLCFKTFNSQLCE